MCWPSMPVLRPPRAQVQSGCRRTLPNSGFRVVAVGAKRAPQPGSARFQRSTAGRDGRVLHTWSKLSVRKPPWGPAATPKRRNIVRTCSKADSGSASRRASQVCGADSYTRVPASRMSPHRQLRHLCQAYSWPSSNTVSALCVALDTVASEEDPSLKRRSAELRFWLIFRSTVSLHD